MNNKHCGNDHMRLINQTLCQVKFNFVLSVVVFNQMTGRNFEHWVGGGVFSAFGKSPIASADCGSDSSVADRFPASLASRACSNNIAWLSWISVCYTSTEYIREDGFSIRPS